MHRIVDDIIRLAMQDPNNRKDVNADIISYIMALKHYHILIAINRYDGYFDPKCTWSHNMRKRMDTGKSILEVLMQSPVNSRMFNRICIENTAILNVGAETIPEDYELTTMQWAAYDEMYILFDSNEYYECIDEWSEVYETTQRDTSELSYRIGTAIFRLSNVEHTCVPVYYNDDECYEFENDVCQEYLLDDDFIYPSVVWYLKTDRPVRVFSKSAAEKYLSSPNVTSIELLTVMSYVENDSDDDID